MHRITWILLTSALLSVTAPVLAQATDDTSVFTADSVRAFLWNEGLLTAQVAADGIEDALNEDSTSAAAGLSEPDRAATFRRSIAVASHGAAAAASTIQAALYLTISKAMEQGSESPPGEMVLGAGIYALLAGVVDDAADAVEAQYPPEATDRVHWRTHVVRLRAALADLWSQAADVQPR